jgi:hypothetical protein
MEDDDSNDDGNGDGENVTVFGGAEVSKGDFDDEDEDSGEEKS